MPPPHSREASLAETHKTSRASSSGHLGGGLVPSLRPLPGISASCCRVTSCPGLSVLNSTLHCLSLEMGHGVDLGIRGVLFLEVLEQVRSRLTRQLAELSFMPAFMPP